jgi:hypothetical protein
LILLAVADAHGQRGDGRGSREDDGGALARFQTRRAGVGDEFGTPRSGAVGHGESDARKRSRPLCFSLRPAARAETQGDEQN